MLHLIDHGVAISSTTWLDLNDTLCPRWTRDWHSRLEAAQARAGHGLPSYAALLGGPLAPPSPADRAAQRRTLHDMRSVGAAWASWLTDRAGAAAAGRSATPPKTIEAMRDISVGELSTLLVSQYLPTIPTRDGWSHPYQYRIGEHRVTSDLLTVPVALMIRSPGRDGRFDGDVYPTARLRQGRYYRAGEVDHDLVWMDGFFVEAPGSIGPPCGDPCVED